MIHNRGGFYQMKGSYYMRARPEGDCTSSCRHLSIMKVIIFVCENFVKRTVCLLITCVCVCMWFCILQQKVDKMTWHKWRSEIWWPKLDQNGITTYGRIMWCTQSYPFRNAKQHSSLKKCVLNTCNSYLINWEKTMDTYLPYNLIYLNPDSILWLASLVLIKIDPRTFCAAIVNPDPFVFRNSQFQVNKRRTSRREKNNKKK